MIDKAAHMAYLQTYASYADHPHAPLICLEARAIIESAVAQEASNKPATVSGGDNPAPIADPINPAARVPEAVTPWSASLAAVITPVAADQPDLFA